MAATECGAPLTSLLRRFGDSAAILVEYEFLTINGDDIARINVELSDHPVCDTKGGGEFFYWRHQERIITMSDHVPRRCSTRSETGLRSEVAAVVGVWAHDSEVAAASVDRVGVLLARFARYLDTCGVESFTDLTAGLCSRWLRTARRGRRVL